MNKLVTKPDVALALKMYTLLPKVKDMGRGQRLMSMRMPAVSSGGQLSSTYERGVVEGIWNRVNG